MMWWHLSGMHAHIYLAYYPVAMCIWYVGKYTYIYVSTNIYIYWKANSCRKGECGGLWWYACVCMYVYAHADARASHLETDTYNTHNIHIIHTYTCTCVHRYVHAHIHNTRHISQQALDDVAIRRDRFFFRDRFLSLQYTYVHTQDDAHRWFTLRKRKLNAIAIAHTWLHAQKTLTFTRTTWPRYMMHCTCDAHNNGISVDTPHVTHVIQSCTTIETVYQTCLPVCC
jgi:hypothetical protein